MVYNFLCKDENTRRNIYLLLLKTSVWKEVRHFFRTVYPNRNHVTTHPEASNVGPSLARQRNAIYVLLDYSSPVFVANSVDPD